MELKIYKGAHPKIVHNKYEQVFSRLIENLEKKLHIDILVKITPWFIDYPETFKIKIICKFDKTYWNVQNSNEWCEIYITSNSQAKQSLYKILTEWLRGGYDITGRYAVVGADDAIFVFRLITGSLWTCLCHGKTPIEWLMQLDLGTAEWHQIY